jgi:hypothetical protein
MFLSITRDHELHKSGKERVISHHRRHTCDSTTAGSNSARAKGSSGRQCRKIWEIISTGNVETGKMRDSTRTWRFIRKSRYLFVYFEYPPAATVDVIVSYPEEYTRFKAERITQVSRQE